FFMFIAHIVIAYFENEPLSIISYGWFLISAMYLIGYAYQRHQQYLTLKNGTIEINTPFGKKMNLAEVKRIKKFAGDYILKTEKKELVINTHIIDPSSLSKLNAELEKLSVEWA
ncbi:MAG: hypothetical protein RIA69_02680, partial [Cyclobacteriaceae bacterium]